MIADALARIRGLWKKANTKTGSVSKMRRRWLSIALIIVAGCATPIGVRRASENEVQRELTASILSSGHPSAPSMQFLERLSLTEKFEEDPRAVLSELHAGLGQPHERGRLFALAELSYAYAERSNDRPYFLASAVYAYAFLFPTDRDKQPESYDPRVRLAFDLYNRGITNGLAEAHSEQVVDLNPRHEQLLFGSFDLDSDPGSFHYGGYGLTHFVPLADLKIRGLRNRYRRPGIGAALAAQVVVEGNSQVDKWIPPRAKVPVTAFVRLDDPRQGINVGAVHGRIELYDVDETPDVAIGDYIVPLEFETSSTLAYRLEGSPLWDFEILGFRRGDFRLFPTKDNTGLFMLHPYHPGRIPVVFVHGTASSPARWAEMANELTGDSLIGRNYQLWYFIYNTGNPIPYSAMRLREALRTVVADVDPQGADPALQRMVVIGHSQGGLLTKMTEVDSGSRFWDNVSNIPFAQAKMNDVTREMLRKTMFVEPLPFVKSLIFICTPHRGSFLADNFLGNIARKLVNIPATITKTTLELAKLNPVGAFKTAVTIPTSIDNMKWSNPFLKTLASLPIAPGVHAHSIIAVKGDGPPEKGDDGVVAYSSAHIDGVDSEFIVRSGHSTQSTPETIEEVRRILYEHLLESSVHADASATPEPFNAERQVDEAQPTDTRTDDHEGQQPAP